MIIKILSFFSTYGFELNNRELATLFWLILLTVFSFTIPDVRSSLIGILKMIIAPKLAILWIVYIVWILIFVVIADWVGFWRMELTKDTFVWMVTAGIGILGGFTEAKEIGYFRRAIVRVLSIVVILEYLINLTTFSLLVEILLQPILSLIIVAPIVANEPEQQENWRKVRDYSLIIFAIGLLSLTVRDLYGSPDALDLGLILLRAIWPILLGLWVLILVFGLAVIATYEKAFIQLKMSRREDNGLWKAKIGLVLALRLRLKLVHEAAKGGIFHVAQANNVTEAYDAAENFKQELAESKQG